MDKWIRNYKLTIQNDGEEAVVVQYPLTLELAITRATYAMAGAAMLRIFNLSKETRGRIYRNFNDLPKLMTIKLEAGYGDNLSTIFDGNVVWAKSSRGEGQVNFITEINALDYGYAKSNSTSDWSAVGADASKDKVIRRLCSDLKRPVNGVLTANPVGAIGSFDKADRRTFHATGNTWELLKTETGDNCFIDNGKVYCMAPNEVVDGDITEISDKTGLLGSPQIDGVFLFADTVFEPGLRVGQRVNLLSTALNTVYKDFSGVRKIIGLEHSGTISGAVCGKLKTRVTLSIGSESQQDSFVTVKEGQ